MSDLGMALQDAVGERYRIGKPIGRGGAGEVFRAYDVRHDRDVAIKALLPEVARATGSARFEREIRLAARLQHPHILPVFDSGSADGLLWYVMPLVEGESLDRRLDREGALPIAEARRICAEAAEALAYAHRHGVVHRDIKPGNLLLGEGGVLVADFGVAMALAPVSAAEPLTRVGLAVGSPSYMSPEQGFGDEDVDGRSDVYSLGCVLYHCLTGRPPFEQETARAVLARHASEDPVPPRAIRLEIPLALEQAALRALEKRPADRFGSAAELEAAISGRAAEWGVLGQLARSVTRRRVINAMAVYLAAVLVVVLLLALLVDRLLVSPGLPTVAGTFLGLLTPAVGAVAYFGRRGRRLALGPVAFNFVLALGIAIVAFDWQDVLPPVAARTVVTEEGGRESRLLPVPSARRRVAIFPFTKDGGASATDWRSTGLSSGLAIDLSQDEFFDVETDFSRALQAGDLSGTRAPATSLMMTLAAGEDYTYAVGGEYAERGDALEVRYDLYDVDARERMDTLRVRAADWGAATDSASRWLRRRLGIPDRYVDSRPDDPASQLLTPIEPAFAEYATGRGLIQAAGDYEEAVPHFERAVALDSSFAEAWASLSTAYMTARRFDDARRAIAEAVRHRYRLSERRSLQVRQSYALLHDQEQTALRLLERYVSIFPDDLEERQTLATAYLQRDEVEKARLQYDSILQIDSTYVDVELNIAILLISLGEPDSALVHLRRYRRHRQTAPLEMGRLYEWAGQVDTAAALYDEAQVANPASALPSLEHARLARRAGDRRRELELLERARELADTPDERRNVAVRLSRYYLTDGRLAEARDWWDRASTASAQAETALQHGLDQVRQGDVLVQLGRSEAARTQADEALTLSSIPLLGELYSLGRLQTYRALGERDSVRAILGRYRAATAATGGLPPQRWILNMARGDVARWSNDAREAEARYREAAGVASTFDLDRQLASLWTLAEVRLEAGSAAGAVTALEEALALAPSSPETHLRLGRALLATADTANARIQLERARAEWGRADRDHEGAAEVVRLLAALPGGQAPVS